MNNLQVQSGSGRGRVKLAPGVPRPELTVGVGMVSLAAILYNMSNGFGLCNQEEKINSCNYPRKFGEIRAQICRGSIDYLFGWNTFYI